MKFFNKTQLALSAAVIALLQSNVMATPSSIEIEVASGQKATLASPNLEVATSDTLNKTGAGALLLSGDHSVTGGLDGSLNLNAGSLEFDNANSFGSAANSKVLTMNNTTSIVSQIGGNIILARPIVVNNAAAASVTIDANNKEFALTLPAISASVTNDAVKKVTVNFRNTAASAINNQFILGGAYTKSATEASIDVMNVGPNVNLSAGAANRLAPIVYLQGGSKLSITGETPITLASKITSVAPA